MADIDIIKKLLEIAQQGQAIDELAMVRAVRGVNLDIKNKPGPVTCIVCGKTRGPFKTGLYGIIFSTQITLPDGKILSGAEGTYSLFVDKDCWPLLRLSSILYTKTLTVTDIDDNEDDDDNDKKKS